MDAATGVSAFSGSQGWVVPSDRKSQWSLILMQSYCDLISDHFQSVWGAEAIARCWNDGPVAMLPSGFHVLEFPPREARRMWTYATCCMSDPGHAEPIELHLFSPEQSAAHVELLTCVAHFHCTGARLGLGHTVNFGRPWMPESQCDHGLISLPYLDGPALESCLLRDKIVRFLWLIPITERERDFKKENGLERLEQELEKAQFDYLDPSRASVV